MSLIVKEPTKTGTVIIVEGRALWPKLTQPDTHFEKDGVYSTKIILTDSDKEQLEATLENIQKAAVRKAVEEAKEKGKVLKPEKVKLCDLPLTEQTDKDTGDGTGVYTVSAKSKAAGVKKDGKRWERQVPIFDGTGKRIPHDDVPEIWNGSILRVNILANPFYVPALGAGVSMRIQGVQIVELATGGGADADSLGFGAVDGGYEAQASSHNDYDSTPERAFSGDADAEPGEEEF